MLDFPDSGDPEGICGNIGRIEFANGNFSVILYAGKNRRGVPVIRTGAEIRPEEPDPDHAGVGITMAPGLLPGLPASFPAEKIRIE